MKFSSSVWIASTFILLMLFAVGCDPKKKSNGDGDGHDHGHSHAKTPHGGHLIELINKETGGKEEFHAEWKHDDDSGKVTIYILDATATEDYAIAADEISIEVTFKGKKPSSYYLAAVNRNQDDPPKTAQFELVDQELRTSLNIVGKEVKATLAVEIDGKQYEGIFEHHDPGHKH